jgi:hypothetical protein
MHILCNCKRQDSFAQGIKDPIFSSFLSHFPLCLVTDQYGWIVNMKENHESKVLRDILGDYLYFEMFDDVSY